MTFSRWGVSAPSHLEVIGPEDTGALASGFHAYDARAVTCHVGKSTVKGRTRDEDKGVGRKAFTPAPPAHPQTGTPRPTSLRNWHKASRSAVRVPVWSLLVTAARISAPSYSGNFSCYRRRGA